MNQYDEENRSVQIVPDGYYWPPVRTDTCGLLTSWSGVTVPEAYTAEPAIIDAGVVLFITVRSRLCTFRCCIRLRIVSVMR